MYRDHEVFETPPDDTVLWRYLDFTKLVSLISTGTLFFSRADLLGDRFEGSYPRVNAAARFDSFKAAGIEETAIKGVIQSMKDRIPKIMFVNCWHENVGESVAMWKVYLKSDEGIAIKTTVGRLKACLQDPENVFIGKVSYIDYDKETIREGNAFYPFLHKRKSFEYEREVRAIALSAQSLTDPPPGLKLKIDVPCLVEAVHLAPGTAPWFGETVRSVMEKFGCNVRLHQSRLDDAPLY